MFGVIEVFVVQVFLFGVTRAQCGITCSPCKEISEPADLKGNWSLLNPTSSRCEWNVSCLYRRDDDGKEMCFCDPGTIVYEECKQFEWGLCYNYTDVDWIPVPTGLANNDVASCDKFCQDNNPTNTFFQLGSTNLLKGDLCGCGQTEPSSDLVVDPAYCWISCPGENTQKCGGFNTYNNNRYVNIWSTFPRSDAIPTDGACYNSTIPIYTIVTNLANNSVQACNKYNLDDDGDWFTYFGLGSSILNNGIECYTGYKEPPADQLVSPELCKGSPCPGNNDEECGYYQNWNNRRYINIWKKIN